MSTFVNHQRQSSPDGFAQEDPGRRPQCTAHETRILQLVTVRGRQMRRHRHLRSSDDKQVRRKNIRHGHIQPPSAIALVCDSETWVFPI